MPHGHDGSPLSRSARLVRCHGLSSQYIFNYGISNLAL